MGEREAGRQACSPGLLNVLEEQTRNRRKTRISPRAGAKPAHRGRETARAPGAPHTPREPLTHSPPPPPHTHTGSSTHAEGAPHRPPHTHSHRDTPPPLTDTLTHTPKRTQAADALAPPHRQPLTPTPGTPPPLTRRPPRRASRRHPPGQRTVLTFPICWPQTKCGEDEQKPPDDGEGPSSSARLHSSFFNWTKSSFPKTKQNKKVQNCSLLFSPPSSKNNEGGKRRTRSGAG